MAKIGVVGDIHWSKYSSIVRSRGEKYSTRLENCIQSVNWAEDKTRYCDMVVYLGDFFDKAELSAEEITALNEIKWNSSYHVALVGNHEMGMNDLSFSSSHVFNMTDIFKQVIDKPNSMVFNNYELCFLPYVLESNRKQLSEYFSNYDSSGRKRIIFSHNDIKDFQMGGFVSTAGFEMDEIKNNCDLFINGHLHNGGKVSDKIFNIGNLTGQNFSEDATRYDHVIFIIDTDTMQIEVWENPYAINFYKLNYATNDDAYDMSCIKGENCVVTVKAWERLADSLRKKLEENTNVIAHRVVVVPDPDEENKNDSTLDNVTLSVDHLEKFKEFVVEKLGTSDVVKKELMEVVK